MRPRGKDDQCGVSRGDEHAAEEQETDQSPSRTFHVSVCVPTPEAEAAQKHCSRRRPLGHASRDWKVRDSEGIEVNVLDIRVGHGPPRYLATAASGPMPMKSVFPPALSPRIRTLPNQLSFRTQPAPSVSTSSRVRVRA